MTTFSPTFTETEVTFSTVNLNGNIPFSLCGTLSIPSTFDPNSKVPSILLVAGSGPIDRDGSVIKHGAEVAALEIYKLLSHYLSTYYGAMVLRYDKRGVKKSIIGKKEWKSEWGNYKGGEDIYWHAGVYDLVDDAYHAYKYLASHPNADLSKLFILGHSEGAMTIPLIVKKIVNTPSLPVPFGVALIAGFGPSLLEACAFQREFIVREIKENHGFFCSVLRTLGIPEKIEKDGEKQIQKILEYKGDCYSTWFGLVKTNAKWFKEHSAYDPFSESQSLNCHVLVTTGEKDIQCDPSWVFKAPYQLTSAASVEAFVVPNMSHLLRHQTTKPTFLSTGEYPKQMKLPLSEELLKKLSKWLEALDVGKVSK